MINIKNKRHLLIYTFSIKKYILPTIFILFTVALIIFSSNNLLAAKNGLKLWANNVVPALLPFFIATELLSYTDVSQKVSNLFSNFMRPAFNVPGNGAYAFVLGLISGYPVGAKIVTSFRNSNLCTKDEGERMLCFTNNSGPLFIVGTVGITLFRSTTIGILLLITHILSSITVGIMLGIISRICPNKKQNDNQHIRLSNSNKSCSIANLGEIMSNSILSSIKTILLIGGFIVLFSVIISILNSSNILNMLLLTFKPLFKAFGINSNYIKPLLTGLVELTNGVSLISNVPSKILTINVVMCAFLLGFGGLSVLLQVLSITSKSDLSIKKYIFAKLLQGIIAGLYTYILISSFTFLNFNLC